jgi:hypothetical protein
MTTYNTNNTNNNNNNIYDYNDKNNNKIIDNDVDKNSNRNDTIIVVSWQSIGYITLGIYFVLTSFLKYPRYALYIISGIIVYYMIQLGIVWYEYHCTIPSNVHAYRIMKYWFLYSYRIFYEQGIVLPELMGAAVFLKDFTARPGESYLFWMVRYRMKTINDQLVDQLEQSKQNYYTISSYQTDITNLYHNHIQPAITSVDEKIHITGTRIQP